MRPDWKEEVMEDERNDIVMGKDNFCCEILTKRPSSKRSYRPRGDAVVYKLRESWERDGD